MVNLPEEQDLDPESQSSWPFNEMPKHFDRNSVCVVEAFQPISHRDIL